MKPYGKNFRIGPIDKRREIINQLVNIESSGRDAALLELADTMVEQAVGYMAIPMGLAGPIQVDGKEYMIPIATEEPSVIAAASWAGQLVNRYGGVLTESASPVMSAHVYLENTKENIEIPEKIKSIEPEILEFLEPLIESMSDRGGGWRGMEVDTVSNIGTVRVTLKIDVRDSMGANLLNTLAEKVRPLLEDLSGGKALMSILSNSSRERRASARFALPVTALNRRDYDGMETACRIVRATELALHDSDRAVTHNKGIMNGISGLALATCNDVRAIEAAAHAWASRDGSYRALSRYRVDKDYLIGELDMPMPFAVTGGSVNYHPTSRWAINQLAHPDAPGLSRIAVALGLLQNLAALRALVCEGIQQGHMGCHKRRKSLLKTT